MSTLLTNSDKAAQQMSEETTSKLQELVCGLKDSVEHHRAAAESVNDAIVRSIFLDLANEREEILETIGGLMRLADETPEESASLYGKLKTCWTSFRASLNGGDETVVLIEAEKAEDTLLAQFREILPEIAGNPINDMLLKYFDTVKAGHDRVLAMRNQYQSQS